MVYKGLTFAGGGYFRCESSLVPTRRYQADRLHPAAILTLRENSDFYSVPNNELLSVYVVTVRQLFENMEYHGWLSKCE